MHGIHGISHLKQLGYCLESCDPLGSNINDDTDRFHEVMRLRSTSEKKSKYTTSDQLYIEAMLKNLLEI